MTLILNDLRKLRNGGGRGGYISPQEASRQQAGWNLGALWDEMFAGCDSSY